jgi:hypothetical protein
MKLGRSRDWDRTSYPQLRRLVLYPNELRGHNRRLTLFGVGLFHFTVLNNACNARILSDHLSEQANKSFYINMTSAF